MPPVAVHLRLEAGELEEALRPFGVGPIQTLRGLAEGSINTNHRVETPQGAFFARLAFGRQPADVAHEAALLDRLKAAGLPVVPMRRTAAGEPALPLRGGLLSCFPWAPGGHLAAADVAEHHLWELGRLLGRLRRLGASVPRRENPYGPEVVAGWLGELEASGGHGEAEVAAALPLLRRGLEAASRLALAPEGLVHADLFRDNVLWLGERVSCLLDFEMACTAPVALDPAVVLLDWGWEGEAFAPARVRALAEGYRAEARGEAVSAAQLAPALAFAACRFTLSRLRDFHFSPLPPEALARKDWREMRARLTAALALGEAGAKALWEG